MADLRRLAGVTGIPANRIMQAAEFAEASGNAALAAAIRGGTASAADVQRAVRDSFLQSRGIKQSAPPAGVYDPPNITDKPASREVPAAEPTLDERIDLEPNVRDTVRENLPAISAANPDLAKRILAGEPGANAQAYQMLADAGGDLPPPPPPEIRDLIPSRERPKPQVWIQPSGVVGPTPSPIGLPGYPIGPGVPVGAPAGRQGQLRLPLTARGPGVPVGGPLVPDWMALRPEDVIAPPRSAPGLPGPTVATPRTQQFGPGVGVNLTTRGTPSARPVRDVTPGGTGIAEDVMASPVQGTEIDFSSPVDGESMSMSIPSEFTVANDISTGSSPARQRFLGDVSATGRQPSAIELDGNAPFGWPGADRRLGVTTDVNPTAGMGDIYEVTPEPGAAAFRSDDPALTTMGDLPTLDSIALDTAQLDDLIPTLERPQSAAPQVAEEVAQAAEEAVQAADAPAPPSPQPSLQDATPAPAQPPGPPLPQWARAPITNRILRGGRGAANNYGGDIGIALGLTGLGAGLYSAMNGEPGVEPAFAAFDQASPAPAVPPATPPVPTVLPGPMERVEGAPQAEIVNEDLTPSAPAPQPEAAPAEAPVFTPATGPVLTGVERAQQAAKARELLARGAMTREEIMAHEMFSRLPSDHLARTIKAGEDQRARRERVKLAGMFSAGGRMPWGQATSEAIAFEALPEAERQVYLQQRLLRPGQIDSPTLRAMRDRLAMQSAREEAEAGRQSNENVARINAQGEVDRERVRGEGAVAAAEIGASVTREELRKQSEVLNLEIQRSKTREAQLEREGKLAEANAERRFQLDRETQLQRNQLLEREIAVKEREGQERPVGEIVDRQSLEASREKLTTAANTAFGRGRSKAEARREMMRAAPQATPGAIDIILNMYPWPS